jgi:hypothetical protein
MSKPFFAWQNKELKEIIPEDVIRLSTERKFKEMG